MAVVIKSLWVRRGTLTLPGKQVPFWGLATSGAGTPALPGPTIEAAAGDWVVVELQNREISFPVSLMFPGQEDVLVARPGLGWKRVSPEYRDEKMTSFTDSLEPGSSAAIIYVFRALRAGIFLYESGTNPEAQVQMGLYGTVVVRPRGHDFPSSRNYKTAYGAGTASGFDIEKVLVLGEVDSRLHDRLDRGMGYEILDYSPDYWLINGRSYPDTEKSDDHPDLPSQPSGASLVAKAGQRVLLRVLNAGFFNHTLHFGGLTGHVIAGDGFPLVSSRADASYQKTATTMGSGQTFDVVLTPEYPGEYYLRAREYDRIVNAGSFPGGVMARITVTD